MNSLSPEWTYFSHLLQNPPRLGGYWVDYIKLSLVALNQSSGLNSIDFVNVSW